MSEIAIRASGLGKRYQIGQRQREDTLRNVIGPILRAPWKLLEREKKETKKGENIAKKGGKLNENQ